ncbi:MAG: response regulator [Pseudomonadota bacterium]|nr:response regulator [Pseudomonadota bacterium]
MSRPLREILIVDDNPADAFLHREVLQGLGVAERLTDAEHGQAAISVLRERREQSARLPELVLLDVNMPVMDGWEFLDQASDHGLLATSTVVMLRATSVIAAESIQPAAQRLPNAWLDKPLDAEAVARIVHKLVRDASAP